MIETQENRRSTASADPTRLAPARLGLADSPQGRG